MANREMVHHRLTCFFIVVAAHWGVAQEFPELRITLSRSQFNRLKASSGTSLTIADPVLLMSGDTLEVRDMHTRGNNSLLFRRKSLAIDLQSPATIKAKEGSFSLKEFHLLNLSMDKGSWHNRWAFLCLAGLGLFPLQTSFCTVIINGEHQGFYLLVEKPHKAAFRLGSPYVIRRGIDGSVDKEYSASSKDSAQAYKKQFLSLYRDARNYSGEPLSERLESGIDLENYFRWLAFNYLIMNGDYSDELYLHINPLNKKFDLIPWDYDDIFSPVPHEAITGGTASGPPTKIYSQEDPFDRAIARDPVLYARYELSMKRMLSQLTDEIILQHAHKVELELEEMARNPEAAEATLYLDKEAFKIGDMKAGISKTMEFLINRRRVILSDLK